ncbi:hypothetical protein DPMN_057207, partial [Dreissena polymorpha]
RASSSEEVCLQTLRDTQVLFTKTSHNWDWDLIEYVLKWPDDKLRKLEDQTYSRFIKRLAFFYKPTNHQFSREPSDHEFQKKYALVGCHLVDFLIRCETEEGQKIVSDLLADIALCLSEPPSTGSRNRLPREHYQHASTLLLPVHRKVFANNTRGSTISSLNYGREGNCRAILSKALCAGQEIIMKAKFEYG